jgi:hypothetical protein
MGLQTVSSAGPLEARRAAPIADEDRAGKIRPLAESDIPQLVELYRKVFLGGHEASRERESAYREHFEQIFLRHPWVDEALPSLVYHEDGKIIGCIGVMPHRMIWNRRPIRAAVIHHFMVDPARRGRLGLRLLKSSMSGPQDLLFATEAGDSSRKIWEGLGGKTLALHGLRWTRALRPGRYILARLQARRSLAPLALALVPLGRAVDGALARRPAAPASCGEDLDEEIFLARLAEVSRERALRPDYDGSSLRWLLKKLAGMKEYGELRKVQVRNSERKIIGWYLYFLKPGGIGEVVQIAARGNDLEEVLDHLFYDGWRQGMAAVSGLLDPISMAAFRAKRCFFYGGSWVMVHSKDPDLLQTIDRGDAFLTRLEGEWPIVFHG